MLGLYLMAMECRRQLEMAEMYRGKARDALLRVIRHNISLHKTTTTRLDMLRDCGLVTLTEIGSWAARNRLTWSIVREPIPDSKDKTYAAGVSFYK